MSKSSSDPITRRASSSCPSDGSSSARFAWLGRCRRLAKDWENLNRRGLAFLRLASIRRMLRKLCKSNMIFPEQTLKRGEHKDYAHMTDKLTTAAPRIAKLLRMVLSPDVSEGEWQNAYSLLMAALKEVDPGGHEITRRIEAPAISEEVIREKIKDEAKKIFEAGRAKGRAEEIESRQRGAVASPRSPTSAATRRRQRLQLARNRRVLPDQQASHLQRMGSRLHRERRRAVGQSLFQPLGKTDADRGQNFSTMVQREDIGDTS